MDNEDSSNINDRLDRAMDILDKEIPQGDEPNTGQYANDPASPDNAKPPIKDAIGGDQEKTDEVGKDKLVNTTPAIEPPISWPGDDKEAFKSLPTWAQETITRRASEQEAHFGERSRTIAARETEINTIQSQAQQAQQHFTGELQRLNQIASQLMPAKFSDISSEADYLRLKVEDPARASEYEAFSQVLRNAGMQQHQALQHQQKQHLDNEWAQLQNKYPEFKDAEKGVGLLNEVRKAAVDYYGYSPQEVQVIVDHRQVPIIRDAISWRNHQANLKAAAGKRVSNTPTSQPLRTDGASNGANFSADQKNRVLTTAGRETDLRRKAEMIASTF